MSDEHPCAGQVHTEYNTYGCSRRGAVEEEGKWWCRQHAPSAVRARRDKRDAKYSEKRAVAEAAERAADALAKRAGCNVDAVFSALQFGVPTSSVSISRDDLDRLLREAGR